MFEDSIEMLNFATESEKWRCHINEFIKELMKNNIRDFLPLGSITHETQAILANAVFFLKESGHQNSKKTTHKRRSLTVAVQLMLT